jgi:hypothetical protein
MSGRTSSHLARRLISLVVGQEGTTLPGENGDIGLDVFFRVLTPKTTKGPGTSVHPDH